MEKQLGGLRSKGLDEQEQVAGQRRMGGIMQGLAWMVLLGLGVFFFADVLERQNNPNRSVESRQGANGSREVVLQRNKYGHYVTSGKINGKAVTFMLDTGATGVAIPSGVAQRLGLRRGRAFQTQTANGIGKGYAVSLDSVGVGEIQLQGVSAGITPGLLGDEVLLGMSFLKHIEFTQRGDTLILRQ